MESKFLTVNDMQVIFEEGDVGVTVRTVSNWVRDFDTEKHAQQYGESRFRVENSSKRKPREYPLEWFQAMVDEHLTTIINIVNESSDMRDQLDTNEISAEAMNFLDKYSLKFQTEDLQTMERTEELNQRQESLIVKVCAKALGIDTDKLFFDMLDDNVNKDLLTYVNAKNED